MVVVVVVGGVCVGRKNLVSGKEKKSFLGVCVCVFTITHPYTQYAAHTNGTISNKEPPKPLALGPELLVRAPQLKT